MTLIRILAGACLLCTSVAASSQSLPPPIEPGEAFAVLADGCGVMFKPEAAANSFERKQDFEHLVWYGPCTDGLIDSEGYLAPPGDPIPAYRQGYILGRPIGSARVFLREAGLTNYYWAGKGTMVNTGANPFAPRWGMNDNTLSDTVSGDFVTAGTGKCQSESIRRKNGCSVSNNYIIYKITLGISGNYTTFYCPDARTSKGCDQLWMTVGKPVFDKIGRFIAQVETDLAAKRARYQSLITPAWRERAKARQKAVLETGTAEQLRDRIGALVAADQVDEAVRLNALLVQRFPASPAVAQAKSHLVAAYCFKIEPRPVLTLADAQAAKEIYESEPCRRMGFAKEALQLANMDIDSERRIAAFEAETDRMAMANDQRQKRESAAHWGAVLGVVTGVVANAVAPSAAATTYSASPSYVPPSAPSAFPGQSPSAGSAESVAHNPANEARSCLVAIDRNGFAANRVSSNMGAVFRNSCGFSVEVTWCVAGGDCNPGYSNIMTISANSDRGISYDASRAGQINWAACRIGFTAAQSRLSRSMQHACK